MLFLVLGLVAPGDATVVQCALVAEWVQHGRLPLGVRPRKSFVPVAQVHIVVADHRAVQQRLDVLLLLSPWATVCPIVVPRKKVGKLLTHRDSGLKSTLVDVPENGLELLLVLHLGEHRVPISDSTLPSQALHAHHCGGEGSSSGVHGIVKSRHNRVARAEGHRSMCRCLNVYGFPQSKPGDRALDIVILCNREIALSVDLHHPEGWMP